MFDLYTDTSKKMKRLPFFLWGVGILIIALILIALSSDPSQTESIDKAPKVSLFEVVGGIFFAVLVAPLSLMRLNDIQKPHSLFWRPTIAYYSALFVAYLGTTALHSLFLTVIGWLGITIIGFWSLGLTFYLIFKKGV